MDKLIYVVPQIERIAVDNKIALQLESLPPDGPNETDAIRLDNFNNNPFDKHIC